MAILLVVMIPAAAFGTPAAQNYLVSVAGTAVGSIPHQIDLKVTQLPGGQITEVSGYALSPEDVVQVKQGENIVVSTSADLATHKVKVTNTQSQLVDLLPLSSNTWSLQGITPGVYKLNVIVDMSSSGIMGAYETVLVILAPGQQPLPPAQYITMIQSVSVRTDIVFKEDSNKCSNSPGSANMGFPYEDVSECEVKGAEDCRKNKIDSNYCEGLKERFRDDCEGFKNKQECDEWWEKESKRVFCIENYGMPCCDEDNIPSGVTCYDEGDPDDCEPGFVDRGFGCEPEECPEGTTGTPPNCIPIEECPEGTTGTPPNCISEGGGGLFNGEGGGDGSGGDGSGGDGSGGDGSGGDGSGGDGGNGNGGGDGGDIDVPSQFG